MYLKYDGTDHTHIILITTTVASRRVTMIVPQFRDCRNDAATIAAVITSGCHAKRKRMIIHNRR